MRPFRRPPRSRHGAVFALAVVLTGTSCGGNSPITPADEARSALETALTTWREGGQPGTLAPNDPPILVADNEWTNGRKLGDFEIIREEPSETDRRFRVALRYDGQEERVEVLYIVIGTHPVSVFREEDYERTINMDNNPVPKKGPASNRFRR